MADDNNVTDNASLWDEAGSRAVTVTTDGAKERLDVDATFSENPYPGVSFRSLLKNGSSSDMAVDGSSTPVEFIASPPTGKIWYIYNLTVVIEDASMNFAKYGGLAELTNGVDFKIKENATSEVVLATIKKNSEYYAFVNNLIIESSNTDILIANINVKINSGTTLKLTDAGSDYVKAVVNDDLTGLDEHYVLIRGYEVDE